MKTREALIELIQYSYFIDMLIEDLIGKMNELLEQTGNGLVRITEQTMDFQKDRRPSDV
ncbi:MAG: hypothetical protein LUO93_08495 [Methanomicrobiales archaeon]|nr:hypothetical protein [Methanomicrobiales archaeon]